MSKIPLSKLRDISQSAKDVITALAGTNDDVSQSDSGKMVQLYDHLNDVSAPPAVVKAMADELINLREHNQRLRAQRIADRRRFSNTSPETTLLGRIQRDAKYALTRKALGMAGGQQHQPTPLSDRNSKKQQ